jgi:hypothetical protein
VVVVGWWGGGGWEMGFTLMLMLHFLWFGGGEGKRFRYDIREMRPKTRIAGIEQETTKKMKGENKKRHEREPKKTRPRFQSRQNNVSGMKATLFAPNMSNVTPHPPPTSLFIQRLYFKTCYTHAGVFDGLMGSFVVVGSLLLGMEALDSGGEMNEEEVRYTFPPLL